jgi:hypothetical protein
MSGPVLRTDLVSVFRLRAFVPGDIAERVRSDLRGLDGVRHVMIAVDPGHETALVTADVDPSAADRVLEDIREIGIHADDLSLSRDEKITLGGSTPLADTRLAWAAVLGEARANARPISRYLLLMAVAGVIAAFGVIDRNDILIVGAMAVSPDLLPLCAACVGLEARRPRAWPPRWASCSTSAAGCRTTSSSAAAGSARSVASTCRQSSWRASPGWPRFSRSRRGRARRSESPSPSPRSPRPPSQAWRSASVTARTR